MGTQFPPPRGTAPIFRPMSVVAKRSPISATAVRLLRYASGETDKQTQSDTLIVVLRTAKWGRNNCNALGRERMRGCSRFCWQA